MSTLSVMAVCAWSVCHTGDFIQNVPISSNQVLWQVLRTLEVKVDIASFQCGCLCMREDISITNTDPTSLTQESNGARNQYVEKGLNWSSLA